MQKENQWTHTNTQLTYITINLTKQHLIVISLRETVQFMCEMKIKVNTQRIHTVKKINTSTNLGLEYSIICTQIYLQKFANCINLQLAIRILKNHAFRTCT